MPKSEKPEPTLLVLDWYFLLEFTVDTRLEQGKQIADQSSEPLLDQDILIQASMPSKPQNGKLRLLLRVTTTEQGTKKCGLHIAVSVIGRFNVTGDSPGSEAVLVNALGILYGAIRETVLTTTGRTLLGPTMLPVVDFQKHVRTYPLSPPIEDKATGTTK